MEQQVKNVSNEIKEIKPLFKEIKPLFKEIKPLFRKVDDSELISNINEKMDKEFNEINQSKSLPISGHIECNDSDRRNNVLLSYSIKEDKIDSLKSTEEIQNTNEYEINSKNKFSELYKTIVDKDVIRIINGGIYIYQYDYGYFKYINNNNEDIEISNLIEREKWLYIRPNIILDIIKKLKSDPKLQMKKTDTNIDKYLINCKNGVVDIRNKVLMHHNRNYNFTYVINANYDNFSKINGLYNFNKFINTSLESDESKKTLLLEVMGYLLSSFTSAKKFFYMVGKPHSGKSLLCRIISYMVGKENVSNIPIHKLGERFAIAEYSRNKLNISAESSSFDIKDVNILKAIVGNDELSAEDKGKNFFHFKSEIKLLFAGNHMPNISEDESSTAFTDRLIFLKFNKSTPSSEIDYELENKLKREVDGIFTLSVDYLAELVRNNFNFTIPNESKLFLDEYRNRQNHIEEFIEEYCNIGEEYRVHISDIYEVYENYCRINCIAKYKTDKFNNYILGIDDQIYKKRFRYNDNNKYGYIGIGLK